MSPCNLWDRDSTDIRVFIALVAEFIFEENAMKCVFTKNVYFDATFHPDGS